LIEADVELAEEAVDIARAVAILNPIHQPFSFLLLQLFELFGILSSGLIVLVEVVAVFGAF